MIQILEPLLDDLRINCDLKEISNSRKSSRFSNRFLKHLKMRKRLNLDQRSKVLFCISAHIYLPGFG